MYNIIKITIVLFLICSTASSCEERFADWDIVDDSYYSKLSIGQFESPVTIYLKVDNYRGGGYSLRLMPDADIYDTLSMAVIYVNDKGNSKTLFDIPIITRDMPVEYLLPPTQNDYNHVKVLITSTSGFVRFRSVECNEKPINQIPESKYVFHAHLGYIPFAPENTAPSFESCGKAGFKACITNPISSADSIFFCYHEDHRLFTKDEGKSYFALTGKEFNGTPSDSLLTYDAGLKTSSYWKGTQICKLEEYFATCHKYNMSPTFSAHPIPSQEGWRKIKDLSDKYSLTSRLVIKSFGHNGIKQAYKVFGNSVRSYVDMVYTSDMETVIQNVKSTGIPDNKIGIETGYTYWNQDNVRQVLSSGYYASSFSSGNDGKKLRELILWGITEFTTNYFPFYSEWMDIDYSTH